MDRTVTTRGPARAGRPMAAWLTAACALGALLAFAGGWLAANRSTPAAAHPGEAPSADVAARLPAEPPAPWPARAAAPTAAAQQEQGQAPAPAGAQAPSGRPAPALVSQVTEAARLGLEAARADLVARCVPPARLAAGGPAVPFTFNLTFDGSGREIARGISEDRRARAPEMASCLRRLPLGTLRVPAPGTRVGVRVALALP
jgi:hypothetical protein